MEAYQGSWGSGYADLAKRLNKVLEENPRTDDDGKVMKYLQNIELKEFCNNYNYYIFVAIEDKNNEVLIEN